MKRREFLKLGSVAAALPAVRSFGAAAGGDLPPWAEAKIDEAVARFRAWKGQDEVVSFTFVTDVHSYLLEIASKPDFSNSRYHVLFAQAAADRAGCDFLVDGGDSHFDNEMELRGVNWTIFQGYGGVGRANKPWGARTVSFSRAKDMLFDIVAVKPSVGEFKIFRVGAGGPACDRLCVFHNRF